MFPRPVDELSREHELVCLVLEAMEYEVTAIQRGGPVCRPRVDGVVAFMLDFVDACHHRKEEEALFPALLQRSREADAPVNLLLREHTLCREAIHAVARALPTCGDASARADVARNLAVCARLVHGHVAREDNVLYPLAEWVLRRPEQRIVAQELARIGAEQLGPGGYERYRALAFDLVRLPAAA
jgi:hemerythrin-like domain-containing protein